MKSIVSMAHGIGAVIIAEGVEDESDSVDCLEFGADYLQGYYFSRPLEFDNLDHDQMERRMTATAEKFREKILSRVRERHIKFAMYDGILDGIIAVLSGLEYQQFEEYMMTALKECDILECLYVIDEHGIQVSNTVFREDCRCIRKIFRPDRPGTDQSFKEYFFYLKTGLKKFTSNPYISTASGRMCITISTTFTDRKGNSYVLCCDIFDI